MDSVALDGVFVQENGDEGRGGDGDEGPDDAGEGCSEKECDQDGEAHEIDAGAHDARGEEGALDVDVDEVEDEDASGFGPGIERCDSGCEHDGDDAASDGDDVQKSHEKTEEQEVTDVEKAKDDGAGDAKDKHEKALTQEPFADFALCFFEGAVEAATFGFGEEGEEEVVGVLAFEHEVDAEKGRGKDVEEVGEPVGKGGKEISGCCIDCSGCALGEGVDAELVGQGKLLDLVDDPWDALWEFAGKVAEIAEDGGKAGGEKECQDGGDGDDQEDDGNGPGGLVATKFELGDASYGGHEYDREESTDVEDQQLFLESPGEGKKKNDSEDEEDVAARDGPGLLFVRSEVFGSWGGQLDSPGMLTVGCI